MHRGRGRCPASDHPGTDLSEPVGEITALTAGTADGGNSIGARRVHRKGPAALRQRERLAELVAELNALGPLMLGAYASEQRLLASEQEAGRLHLRPVLVLIFPDDDGRSRIAVPRWPRTPSSTASRAWSCSRSSRPRPPPCRSGCSLRPAD